jgi:hypothetical protein
MGRAAGQAPFACPYGFLATATPIDSPMPFCLMAA